MESILYPEMIFPFHQIFARMITVRRMGWAGHVERMGRGETCTSFRCGNLRERDHLGDPGVDGRIILRGIFREWGVVVWRYGLDRIGSG
jgi:hypothetical protein